METKIAWNVAKKNGLTDIESIRPFCQLQISLTSAHVVVKFLMGRLQLVLALTQVAFALIDFL